MSAAGKGGAARDGGARGGAKCPICGKPVVAAFRPFCSARCKQVDLNRWFSESYRVPDRPGLDDDEAETPPAPPGPEDDA